MLKLDDLAKIVYEAERESARYPFESTNRAIAVAVARAVLLEAVERVEACRHGTRGYDVVEVLRCFLSELETGAAK